jgi:hypothetical protein
MGDILVGPVRELAGGHAEDKPFVSRDDLHIPDDKATVEGDSRKGLQLVFVAQMNPDFCYFQASTVAAGQKDLPGIAPEAL